jgi:hypothetical protein
MKLKVKPTIGKSLCIIVAIVSTSPKGIDWQHFQKYLTKKHSNCGLENI